MGSHLTGQTASANHSMDPITHTFLGAALAQTPLRQRTAYASAALIIGANLPDMDGLAMLADSDTALLLRRGWTHGIPAILILPIVLTGVLIVWGRLTRHTSRLESPPVRIQSLLGLSYLAVATHPTLDWLNNYGMRWLMPFDGGWFYGDAVFIVDPWMWLLLGGTVFLSRSRGWWALVGWAVFALFAGSLLLSAVPGLVPAKILWFVSLGVIILLRIGKFGSGTRTSYRLAVGAVTATVLYIASMLALSQYATYAVSKALASSGLRVEKLMVGPVLVTPFVRDVVAQTSDGYRHGTARLVPRFELELSPDSLPLLPRNRTIQIAAASPKVRGFMNWARFPFSETEENEAGYTVYFLDARYTRSRRPGFGSARVEVSHHQFDSGPIE